MAPDLIHMFLGKRHPFVIANTSKASCESRRFAAAVRRPARIGLEHLAVIRTSPGALSTSGSPQLFSRRVIAPVYLSATRSPVATTGNQPLGEPIWPGIGLGHSNYGIVAPTP